LPSEELAPFVAHFWTVAWDLRAPFTATTLPHPTVHLVFEEQEGVWTKGEVAGVHTARFSRRLTGKGSVFGVKFRPAAFHPFLVPSHPDGMRAIAERTVPVGAVFGPAGPACARAIARAPDFDARVALATGFLASIARPLDPLVARLRDLVERMASDPALVRVGDCAALVGMNARALERSFRRAVGASPKWVLRRYRLHEAAERLKASPSSTLAAIASDLGYADQAHFARDFKRVVGMTPRAFQRVWQSGPP
jgi:AraC-like DNA-binding protein